ncbi:MAG: nucleotide excision repair endonuclease [Chthoniobacter sp.]
MPPPPQKPDFKVKLRDVPHKPGVYIMRDRFHRVIYVGKARNLRKRVSQYFTPAHDAGGPEDAGAAGSDLGFRMHLAGSEPEALLLEGRLIKEFGPRYNISFPRRQALPAGQGGSEGGMAALPPHADEETTRRRSISGPSPTPGHAADAGLHAEEIRRADLWPGQIRRSAS